MKKTNKVGIPYYKLENCSRWRFYKKHHRVNGYATIYTKGWVFYNLYGRVIEINIGRLVI